MPRPALEQVRQETAAPGNQAPRYNQPATRSSSSHLVPAMDGEPWDEQEDAEVTGEVEPGSLKSAVTLLAKNQAALTALLADRD